MFAKIPYFLKHRNFTRGPKERAWLEKIERRFPAEIYGYLRSGNVAKRKIRRYGGRPSFVNACSYQSTERAVVTEEEVRARRGTRRNRSPQIRVESESSEAQP